MPRFDNGTEMLHEQRTQQRGNVQTVGVGVGENADLAVAQAADVTCGGVDTERDGDIVYGLRG